MVKFEIWDTAGQERYRSLAPMYYRGASAALVVYDISCLDSYNGAKSWVKELVRRGDPNVVIGLAGNKCDLEGSKRAVSYEEASEYCKGNGIIYKETSAKTGVNVRDMFVEVARRMEKKEGEQRTEDIKIGQERNGMNSKAGGCC